MRAVVYTRVSTDGQREASHDDQARNCQRIADREGWKIARRYTDHGISGTRSDRPEYRKMLAAAKAREFDVLLIDELSRFSRDTVESEQAIRKLEFNGIRVVSVDGYDSTARGKRLHRGMKALMNAEYIEVVRHETHRGLEGRALSGLSVGGRAYGYRSEPVVDGGGKNVGARVVVLEDEANWVRWIFERYAEGWSPRRIADALNREGVPSPGARWRRTERRTDRKWLASAIYGDPRTGSGILNNEIYRGVRVWNRSRRDVDPETERKVFVQRPASEVVRVDVPHLRIVDDALWDRVRDRQRKRSALVGAKVKAGLSRAAAGGHAGAVERGPKYLFSGILKCGACGANMVVSGAGQCYTCASHTNGGRHACASKFRIPRAVVEERLSASIRDDLLGDEATALLVKKVREFRAVHRKESDAERAARARKAAKLRAEIENLTDAIASGQFRTNGTLADRLAKAEADLAATERDLVVDEARLRKVVDLLPRAVATYRRKVLSLGTAVRPEDVPAARHDVAALLGGEVRVVEEDGEPVAEVHLYESALVSMCLGTKAPAYIGTGSGGRI